MLNLFDIIIIGIIGGLSPGPINALMLGETLKRGFKQGGKVPLALLISNLTFAPLIMLIIHWGSSLEFLIPTLTVTGALILIYMGIQEWKNSGQLETTTSSSTFKKALTLEFLNPHPYIFWFTILGPPIVLTFQQGNITLGVAMWMAFLITIVAVKLSLALVAHKIREKMTPKKIQIILKILAILLILFGLKLLIT
jgi:threonine/homoserine/homoserine lactone efflux protein